MHVEGRRYSVYCGTAAAAYYYCLVLVMFMAITCVHDECSSYE